MTNSKNSMVKRMDNGVMISFDAQCAMRVAEAIKDQIGTECKVFEAGTVPFEELPEDVKAKVKDTLKAFSKVTVEYSDAKFSVFTGCMLCKDYAYDQCVCGTYTAEEIYTPEERIVNYMESFHDYPVEYTGKRDYKMLKELGTNWNAKFALVNGDLVRVA